MNWEERLIKAKNYGSFTDEDFDKADHWESCAVGENTKCSMYGPLDATLRRLGHQFMYEVRYDYVDKARESYRQILIRIEEMKSSSGGGA